MIIALIIFIVLQILLDIYFFWFIVLANTALDIITDYIPNLAMMKIMPKLFDKEDKDESN